MAARGKKALPNGALGRRTYQRLAPVRCGLFFLLSLAPQNGPAPMGGAPNRAGQWERARHRYNVAFGFA
jgi:hypothetical protein